MTLKIIPAADVRRDEARDWFPSEESARSAASIGLSSLTLCRRPADATHALVDRTDPAPLPDLDAERAEWAAASGEQACQACGESWSTHGRTCSGSQPAPLPDLDAAIRSAKTFGRFHTKHSAYRGASQEFHARAETFLLADVPALVERLRAAEAEAARATMHAAGAMTLAESLTGAAERQAARVQELEAALDEAIDRLRAIRDGGGS